MPEASSTAQRRLLVLLLQMQYEDKPSGKNCYCDVVQGSNRCHLVFACTRLLSVQDSHVLTAKHMHVKTRRDGSRFALSAP